MKLTDFDYHLPDELIAQKPIEPRDHSRLLHLSKETGKIKEGKFYNILDTLGENDVLVVNKTKVMNARLHGYKQNIFQRRVEVFLHKQINEYDWECLVFPGKKLKTGRMIDFKLSKDGPVIMTGEVKEMTEEGRIIKFSKGGIEFMEIIEKIGEMPLPPYVKEKLKNNDRYQTVYNEISGSVAAPTAGLHFTPELINKLKNKGILIEKVLLHVGLGTFKTVDVEDIKTHKMHSEYIELEQDVAQRLNQYKSEGKRIIAVGTTSIRVLESFTNETGLIEYGSKDTEIFIYPGYTWKCVDAMITNFHLPKSTLLMLISSFAGKENIEHAYKYAVNNKFRFFSFGDAMFIE